MAEPVSTDEGDSPVLFGCGVAGIIAWVFPRAETWIIALVAVFGGMLVAAFVPARFRFAVSFVSLATDNERLTTHPRVTKWVARGLLLYPGVMVWDYSQPWNESVSWAPLVAWFAFVQRRSLRRALGQPTGPSTGWRGLAVTAAVVVVAAFMFFGGPFRARWAYCEDRLTSEVIHGTENRGPICWPDAGAFTRIGPGVAELIVSSDDGGLIYAGGQRLVVSEGTRELGNGWYAVTGDGGWYADSTDD